MRADHRHLLFSLACAIVFMALTWLTKRIVAMPEVPQAARIAAALVAVVPIGVLIWGMGRHLEAQTDEFQRMVLARGMLLATGFILVFATAWGFLDKYAGLGPFPAMFLFPIWVGAWTVSTLWSFWRYK